MGIYNKWDHAYWIPPVSYTIQAMIPTAVRIPAATKISNIQFPVEKAYFMIMCECRLGKWLSQKIRTYSFILIPPIIPSKTPKNLSIFILQCFYLFLYPIFNVKIDYFQII
jgi:hypothetical protein